MTLLETAGENEFIYIYSYKFQTENNHCLDLANLTDYKYAALEKYLFLTTF